MEMLESFPKTLIRNNPETLTGGKTMKKLIAMLLALVMVFGLVACGGTEKPAETQAAAPEATAPAASEAPAAEAAAGSVYYLNFKPEQNDAWQNLAKAYTEKTGVPVTVLTAASGTYEETLMAEMGKTEAPTLFQVNGPKGLATWKEYTKVDRKSVV